MKKLPKLGNVNACGIATLYLLGGRKVGICMDTPNAIACCIGNGKASYAKHFDGERTFSDINRIENKGWITLEQAMFTPV